MYEANPPTETKSNMRDNSKTKKTFKLKGRKKKSNNDEDSEQAYSDKMEGGSVCGDIEVGRQELGILGVWSGNKQVQIHESLLRHGET